MSGKTPEPDYRIGFALVLVASACFGLGPALGQFAADNGLSPLTTTAWRFVIPVLVLSPFLPRALAHGRLAFVGLAVGAIAALGMVAYFTALRHLSVATVSVIYFTYPLFTILLDRVLFGERIRRRAVAASLMIVAAAAVVVPAGTLSGGQAEIVLLAFAAPVGFAILIVTLSRTLTPIPVLPRASIGLTGALAGLAPGFPPVRRRAAAARGAAGGRDPDCLRCDDHCDSATALHRGFGTRRRRPDGDCRRVRTGRGAAGRLALARRSGADPRSHRRFADSGGAGVGRRARSGEYGGPETISRSSLPVRPGHRFGSRIAGSVAQAVLRQGGRPSITPGR